MRSHEKLGIRYQNVNFCVFFRAFFLLLLIGFVNLAKGQTADFTMSASSGCTPTTITFTDNSTSATTWFWDFGNSNISQDQTIPGHSVSASYPKAGTYTVTLTINKGLAGEKTVTKSISVYPKPNQTVEGKEGCAPFSTTLTAVAIPVTISEYTWSGGDPTPTNPTVGAISGGRPKTYIWNFFGALPTVTQTSSDLTQTSSVLTLTDVPAGVYDVLLTVIDEHDCSTSVFKQGVLKVNPKPVANDFTFVKSNACGLGAVAFSGSGSVTTGTIAGYSWDFDDPTSGSNVSGLQNPTHTFAASGTYSVSYTASSASGCTSDLVTKDIIFNGDNKADFSVSGSCAGQSVSFTDKSSDDVVSRSWNFGDGNTSTEENPAHIYSTSGSYSVVLTVTFTDGCVLQSTQSLSISGATASFTYSTASACPPGYPISFTSIATSPTDDPIKSYAWDFNNDGTDDETTQNQTHSFNSAGTYPVRLTVTTDKGCTNSVLTDVVIPAAAVDFSASPFQGCAQLTTTFTSVYSNSADPIDSYSWDFGDPTSSDNTSTLASPTHKYESPGRYTVILKVKTERDCEITQTKTEYVRVGSPQTITEVTVDQSAYCLTNTTSFTANFTASTDSLVWDFNDGSDLESQNISSLTSNTISHNYTTPGSKSVTVTAYYNGCPSGSYPLSDIIINEPTSDFTVSKSVACSLSDASFTFTDNSTGATSYIWDFGDGTSTSTLQSPSHTYSTTGNFVVRLTVQNSTTGCSAVATRTVRVVTAAPSFTVDDLIVCAGTGSTFTVSPNASSNFNFTDASYNWNFGDPTSSSNTSNLQNPTHTYLTPGLYTVSLILNESSGCSYTYTLPTQMDVRGPIVAFTNDPKQICSGTEVSFTDQTTRATNDPATSNSYLWTFGDGDTSSDQNPKHTYTGNGSYTVNLQVTDNLGCVSTNSVTNSVLVPNVAAEFKTTRDAYCLEDAINFTDSSIGKITRYDWDLDGDGNYEIIDGEKNPTKSFTVPGTYTISQRVTSDLGCENSFSKNITVVDGTGDIVDSSGNPVPDYLELGCAPISADLVAEDPTNVVSSYSWNFGDGKSSTLRSPGHYFTMPGTYKVTLTETLTGGCTRTSYINVKVAGAYGKFSYTNTPACAPHEEEFTASELDGVTSLTWDFGGGVTEENSSPTSPATTIKHTYATYGNRLPILILSNDECGDYSYYYGVDQRINTSEPPVAEFKSSTADILTCEKLEFQFTDLSTRKDPRYAVSTWNWDFGDGTTSTLQNPKHTYATANVYTVTLNVTNGFTSDGCAATVSHTVTANPLPLATITNGAQQFCSGESSQDMVLGTSNSLTGSTFDWTRDTPTGITSSAATSGTGLAIDDAIAGGSFTNSTTAPIVVTYTITPKGPSPTFCVGDPITATLTVDPTPAVSSAASKTICNNSSVNYQIESLTTGTTFAWTASELTAPTGGNITGFSDGSGSDISQTLQNSGTTAGVVRYVITPKGPTPNFCPGTPFNFDVTVEPTPTATPSASSVIICSGSAPSLTVDVTVSNGRYLVQSISNPGGVTGVTAAPYTRADGATVDAGILSTTSTTKSVIYTIVPYTYGTNGIDNSGTGDDCLGSSFTVTVNVEPTPAATISTATNRICNKTQPTATVNVTTINGNKYLVSSISNPNGVSGVSTAPYTRADGATIEPNILTNNSNVERTVTYTFRPYNWGPNGVDDNGTGDDCLGATQTIQVIVQPTPAATPSAFNQTICHGSSPTLTVDVTAISGQRYLVSSITNPGGVGGVVAAPYTRPDNGTINAGTFTNLTRVPLTVTFTVIPYTRGSNNADNSGTGDDCLGTPFNVTVIVDPIPLSSPSATSETICSGSNPTITADITAISGNRYLVTSISNPGGVAGVSTAPYTRTDGAIVEPNALTNATNTSQSVVYTCIPYSFGVNGVDNNGTGDDCQGASFTVTEIVEPTPKATPSAVSQNVCNNSVPTLTVDVTAIEGHNYLVSMISNPGLAGGVSIAPYTRGDLATIETGTLTNTTSGVLTVTYTVVPYTNGPNGVDNNGTGDDCVGTSFPVVLYVQPVATVNATPASETICHNLATNITLTSGTVGVVSYSWTAALISGTAGGFLDGSSNTIAQTLTNTTTAPAIVRYTITPAIGGCPGTPIDVNVTVNPAGQFNTPVNQVICNGAATTLVTFATNNTVGTTTYSWTNDLTSIGLAASGTNTPTIPSFTAANSGTSQVTATIAVTPTFTNGGVSCTGSSESFTIKANPSAKVNPISSQIFCNTATAAVNFSTSNTDGTTIYSWTNDNTSIGLANGGSGNLSFTATNTTSAPILANITVTPTYTNDGVSCTGSSESFTITVNPSGQVTNPGDKQVCNNSITDAITFTTVNSGGTTTYSWTNDTPTIGLAASGSEVIPQFTAINTGTVAVVATIKVIPTFKNEDVSCSGAEQSFTFTVNPTPTVTSSSLLEVCSGSSIDYTPTFSVASTTYSWTAQNTIGTVTGFTASGTGTITDELTNTGSGNGQVTYTITPEGPTNCKGPEFQLKVNVVNCKPIIGIAQQLVSLSANDDGSHDAIINFRVQNYGNVPLTSISVPADLTTLFGAGNYIVLGLSSTSFDVNTNFTGDGDLLDNSGTTNDLLPGASTDIRLTVRITAIGTFNHSVEVSANSIQGTVTDVSQDGSDPDPDGDGDPTDNNNRVATPITISCVLPTISFSPAEATVCEATPYTFDGVSVSKYSTLSWSVVSGSGTFDNTDALNPAFTPSSTGPIILRLTANSLNTSCDPVTKDFTLIVNLTPTLTATSIINTTCGNSSGSVQLTGSVSGNVTLNGTTQASGSTFSGLTAGNYMATFVSTETGCTTSTNFVIANTNSDLRGTVEVTDPACFGGRGSATVTVTGGQANYQFALDNAAYGTAINSATVTYTDLSVGAHYVRVKDADGCTFSISFEVHAPNLLVLSLSSQTNVSCYGTATGSAIVVTRGGKAPYIYSIDGVNYQSDNVFSNLAASPYTITVKDFNDCTTTLPLTITQPASALDITTAPADLVNPTCNGASTGSIDITVSGGISPYRYAWSNGYNGEDLTAVPAGSYTVNVTDANGCTATQSYTLGQPDALVLNTSGIVNTQCNASVGSVTLTEASSTAGTFAIDGQTSQTGTTATFTGLKAGFYTATFTSTTGGCTATTSFNIANTNSDLTATVSVPAVACFGDKAKATVSATGGTGSYTYSINGGSFVASNEFANLGAGSYNIVVKDGNDCTFLVAFGVSVPSQIVSHVVSQTNATCFGSSTGSIILTSSGGTAPYEYSIDGGTNYQTSNVFTGLSASATAYTITTKDAGGCTIATTTATITQPSATLTATAAIISDVTCNGNSNGSATVSTAGGTAPYTYLWSNGSTDHTATNLAAGDYTVTVTDKNGCTATSNTITIGEPSMITLQTPFVVNANCQGGLNGSVQLRATGGTGMLTYSISTGVESNTTGSFSNLSAGGYTYTVTDATGCSATGSFKITDPNLLTLTVNSEVDVNCYSGTNGSASVTANGGTAPYTFAWTGPGITTPLLGNTSGTTNELTGRAAGTFIVTVTDQSGCQAVQTIEIEQPTELSIQLISKSDEHCQDNNGSIVMGATGGTPSYRFTSSPALSFGTSNSVTNVLAGDYTITVTDVNGCTASMLVTITEPACVLTIVNDYPSTLEDTQLKGNVLTNDSDPNGLPLTVTQFVVGGNSYTISNGSSNTATITGVGTIEISSDGDFTFTPGSNYNGPVPNIVYTVSNGSGAATGNLSITVIPVDDTPAAATDDFNATENVVLTGNLTTNDTPSGDGGNIWSVVTGPTNGTLVINPDGTFTYTPAANYNGPDSFSYKICDVDGDCTTATSVTLNVGPVNNAPVISNVILIGNEDAPVTFNGSDFSSQFNDIDGDPLVSIKITSLPANGTLTLNGVDVQIGDEIAVADLPNLQFTPDSDWNGSTSFGWDGSDGISYSNNPKEVTMTIGAVNDLPAAGSATTVAQVNPGGINNVVVYASNFGGTDVDGTISAILITTMPANATSITVDGTTYTSIPTGGIQVSTDPSGKPLFPISIDPADGVSEVIISYYVVDNLGGVSDSPGSVTVPFSGLSVSGTVYNDVNGLFDNTVGGTGANAGGLLAVNLVNTANQVVSSKIVGSNGSYSFSDFDGLSAGSSYKLILTNGIQSVGSTLSTATYPAGWVSTGENIGSGAGNDGTIDGILSISTNSGSVANANFGINSAMTLGAGVDDAICSSVGSYALNSANATNYSSVTWTTNGTGTFTPDHHTVNAVYIPTISDIATGQVQLTLTAVGVGSVSTLSDQMTLTIWPAATAYAGPDAAICSGNSFVLTAATATNFTKVTWSAMSAIDGTFDNPNALNPTFTPSRTGEITLTMTVSGKGVCADEYSEMKLTVEDAPTLVASAIQNTTCNNSVGAVTLTGNVSGMVTLNGESKVSPATFTGLTAGYFIATFKPDHTDCLTTTNFQITNTDNNLLVTARTTDPLCYGGTGSAVINTVGGTVSGGSVTSTDGYQYRLDGGTAQSDNTFTGLSVGNHTVRVTDDNGCYYSIEFDIDQPTRLGLSLSSKTNITCQGAEIGEAMVWAYGGTPGYTYQLNALPVGSTATMDDNIISGMTAGNYTVQVMDDNGCVATLPIVITKAICKPIPVNDLVVAPGDVPANGNVLTNDSDPNGLPLTVIKFNIGGISYNPGDVATIEGVGTMVVKENGDYTFTPLPNYNGTVPVTTYTVTNGSQTADASIFITITPVNHNPVAKPDVYNGSEDAIIKGNLGTNDALSGDGGNIWSLEVDPLHGTVTVNIDGTFTYVPDPNYNDPDQFSYKLCDVDGSCSIAVVDIIVAPVNDVPEAIDDQTITEEEMPVSGNVLLNDTDLDGDPLVVTQFTIAGDSRIYTAGETAQIPNVGELLLDSDGHYTFYPAPDYNGDIPSVTYTISDGNGGTDTALLNIRVTPVNDPPVPENDLFDGVENTPIEGVLIGNDTDPDGDVIKVTTTPLVAPLHGTLVLMPDGRFTYKPVIDFIGTDSFVYEVCDNGVPSLCASATVNINIGKDGNCEVFVPTSFSPNGDGLYDYFKVRCLYNYENAIIQIYNRWGNLVYTKDHYGNADFWGSDDEAWWNGKSDHKWNITNDDLPVGTYYYVLKLDKSKVLTGYLYLNK